jgi:hypothetical protein
MSSCNVKWVNGHTNKKDMQSMLHINSEKDMEYGGMNESMGNLNGRHQ